MDLFAWAKIPIIQKWKENAKPSTSTTFIVGETSWVPQVDIKDLRTALSSKNPNVEFHVSVSKTKLIHVMVQIN